MNKWVKRGLITLGVLAVVAICAGIAYVGVMIASVFAFIELSKSLDAGVCDVGNPENAIEQIASFTLPPSANLLDSGCMGMQGYVGYAKFEMAPSDLDTFVSSTKISQPLATTGVPDQGFCQYDLDESTPHLYGHFEAPEFLQYVYVDTSDTELYIVYVCVGGG